MNFCAAVPNLRIMETDVDAVPWRDELVDVPPMIENGEFVLPTRPGWGVEVNEAAVRARKHIFAEKPVAVDAPGVRRVLAATAAQGRP